MLLRKTFLYENSGEQAEASMVLMSALCEACKAASDPSTVNTLTNSVPTEAVQKLDEHQWSPNCVCLGPHQSINQCLYDMYSNFQTGTLNLKNFTDD